MGAGERAVVVNMKYDADVLSGKDSTTWKITDADGSTLVDSEEFSSIYAGETSTNYYCFPETKCLYYLIRTAPATASRPTATTRSSTARSATSTSSPPATSSTGSRPTSSAARPRAPSSRR